MREHYPDAARAEAVGLAVSIGDYAAAERLKIPRRTVTRWRHEAEAGGRLSAVVVETREAVAGKLWEAVVIGTQEVIAGLRDPKARLADKARALEVVAQQHALLSGGATSRVEQTSPVFELSWQEKNALIALLDRMDTMLDSGDVEGAMRQALALRQAERIAGPRFDQADLDGRDRREVIAEILAEQEP